MFSFLSSLYIFTYNYFFLTFLLGTQLGTFLDPLFLRPTILYPFQQGVFFLLFIIYFLALFLPNFILSFCLSIEPSDFLAALLWDMPLHLLQLFLCFLPHCLHFISLVFYLLYYSHIIIALF